MPPRQGTFHIVPTTLVPNGPSRPPMTSKAAKKAHLQSTRLPSVSRAEQRRLEAAELDLQRKQCQQQKKEEEKERAAAKAKAAREKKLKKDKEDKEERRRQGLPEKSRWVRASQPSITGFVKTAVSRKRTRDDCEESDSTAPEERYQLRLPKRKTAPEPAFDTGDDEFGEFPSISQGDLPAFLEFVDESSNSEIRGFNRHQQIGTFPRSLQSGIADTGDTIETSMEVFDDMKEDGLFSAMTESNLLSESFSAAERSHSTSIQEVPDIQLPTVNVVTNANQVKSCAPASGNATSLEDVSTVYHSAKFTTRESLEVHTATMVPPPLPQKINLQVAASIASQSDQPIQQPQIAAPPSTQAFLESHWDDFFPSPSQQVRELLEEVDYEQNIPSNTQVARELNEPKIELQIVAEDLKRGDLQTEENDSDLHFLSSQDFMISSQDLRAMESIDLLNTAAPEVLPQLVASQEADLGLKITGTSGETVSKDPSKPRFFEEKEDDLLQAALRESLLSTNKQPWSSSPSTKRKHSPELLSLVPQDEFSEEEFDGSGTRWIDNDRAMQATVDEMFLDVEDLMNGGYSAVDAYRVIKSGDDLDWH